MAGWIRPLINLPAESNALTGRQSEESPIIGYV